MRILVACEMSGVVRDAFRERGHDAISCDLQESERPGPHVVGDVLPLLSERWDMVIAFPPCTDLCVSGARHFAAKRADGRQQAAIDFFMRFANLDCPQVAIENPVGIMSRLWRKPDQIIQPWQFGHDASKKTCLWLRGLSLLEPTSIVPGTLCPSWIPCPEGCGNYWCHIHRMHAHDCDCPTIEEWTRDPYTTGTTTWSNQTATGQNRLPPSDKRAAERSRTYQGIADAMADQWGGESIRPVQRTLFDSWNLSGIS